MAGHPAPPAVTVELLEGDAALDRWIGPASRLITAEFPRPAMETSEALLRWHLTGVGFDGRHPLAAIATAGGELAGFAAATPRPVACGSESAVLHVVSFVCVASNARGGRVATRLYDALLEGIRHRGGRVLTFAIDQSLGMSVLEAAYRRHGFSERPLGLMPPWAAMRGRIGNGPPAVARRDEPTLSLADSAELRRHLDRDPRGSRRIGAHGARVVSAARLTTDSIEPLLLLEELPDPLDSGTLGGALRDAFVAFPDHGKLLVVPNYPASGNEVARAVGLRRLAGPVYRAWLWSQHADDPLLQAQSTSHPVL